MFATGFDCASADRLVKRRARSGPVFATVRRVTETTLDCARFVAPGATRTPISLVRRVTAQQSTPQMPNDASSGTGFESASASSRAAPAAATADRVSG